MPLRTMKEPKLDPAVIFECWQGFAAGVAGAETAIPAGTRLRGDDPAVQAYPQWFVRNGEPVPSVFNGLEPTPEPEADVVLDHAPVEHREADVAALRRPIKVAVGSDGDGRPREILS